MKLNLTNVLGRTCLAPTGNCIGAVHKGRPQRMGERCGQMRTPANRREGVKDLADVRKMVLF